MSLRPVLCFTCQVSSLVFDVPCLVISHFILVVLSQRWCVYGADPKTDTGEQETKRNEKRAVYLNVIFIKKQNTK